MKHVLTNAYSCQIVFICTLINKLFTWPNFCLPQCTFTSVFVLPLIWLYCLACCLTVVVCCYVFNPDVSWNLRSPKPLDITKREVHVHTDRLCIWTVNLTLIVTKTDDPCWLFTWQNICIPKCKFTSVSFFRFECFVFHVILVPVTVNRNWSGILNFKWLNGVIFGSVVFLHRFLKSYTHEFVSLLLL